MDKTDEEAAAKAVKIDKELYQYVTEENMEEFISLIYHVDDPEGNYLEEFDRKMREGGIEVNEEYQNHLLETRCQVPGVDLRTGLYGLEYAGAGFFSAGCMFFERDDWDNALANFTKTIELRPRYVLAYSMKAQCHLEKEEYLLAAAEMGNAILLNPVAIAERTGCKIPDRESYGEEFFDDLEEILVHAYYLQGLSYHRMGRYSEAISALSRAIKLDPDRFEAIELRVAAIMKKESGWKKAVKDCDRLIANHYKEVLYLQYRGMCCRELHWYRKSVADFTAALAMEPDLPFAHCQRMLAYFENCDFLRARADADEAIKRGVNEAYYYRARTNLNIGDYDDAIADFDKAALYWNDIENINMLRERAEDYKKRGMITHTISPDGKIRDNSKKAGANG